MTPMTMVMFVPVDNFENLSRSATITCLWVSVCACVCECVCVRVWKLIFYFFQTPFDHKFTQIWNHARSFPQMLHSLDKYSDKYSDKHNDKKIQCTIRIHRTSNRVRKKPQKNKPPRRPTFLNPLNLFIANVQISTNIHKNPQITTDIHKYPQISTNIH